MGPRILLTGARGFAGTHFRSCLEARLPGHVLLDGSMDIRDRAAVERFVRSEKPDACLHLAAESSGDNACKWTVNLDGTMNLIETFRLYASEARFVFVSTAEVYGASFASAQSLDETAALAPVSSFAASRAAADMAIGTFSAVGLQGVRLRAFTQTGSGQDVSALLPSIAVQVARIEAREQEPVLRIGNPDAGVDIVDIRDACEAYITAIDPAVALANGVILNICSGTTRSVRSIASDFLNLANVSARIEVDPALASPDEALIMRGNPAAARRVLRWEPRISWTDTLMTVLNDWRNRIRD